jgi:hypothetical protein
LLARPSAVFLHRRGPLTAIAVAVIMRPTEFGGQVGNLTHPVDGLVWALRLSGTEGRATQRMALFKRKAEQQAPAWFPSVEQRTAEWQAENNRLAELVGTAREYRGLSADESERVPVALKSGERVYRITEGATLVESRSKGGHWEGRSSGVSVRMTKSATYRLGESRGVYVRAEDKPTLIDRGTAVITDGRVAFAGAKQSREWLWAKCLGVQHQFDLPWTAISVSNRHRTSGLYYGPVEAHIVRFHLDLAYAVAIDDAYGFVVELEAERLSMLPGDQALRFHRRCCRRNRFPRARLLLEEHAARPRGTPMRPHVTRTSRELPETSAFDHDDGPDGFDVG